MTRKHEDLKHYSWLILLLLNWTRKVFEKLVLIDIRILIAKVPIYIHIQCLSLENIVFQKILICFR